MKLADLLEREGGQVLAGFALLVLGAFFAKLALPKSEDVIVCALTLIARAMLGRNGKS